MHCTGEHWTVKSCIMKFYLKDVDTWSKRHLRKVLVMDPCSSFIVWKSSVLSVCCHSDAAESQ